jgi:hypothetical protein
MTGAAADHIYVMYMYIHTLLIVYNVCRHMYAFHILNILYIYTTGAAADHTVHWRVTCDAQVQD